MKTEPRCDGSLVVAGFVEACGKEVVGKIISLGKAVDTFENFGIDLATACFAGQVVFLENYRDYRLGGCGHIHSGQEGCSSRSC